MSNTRILFLIKPIARTAETYSEGMLLFSSTIAFLYNPPSNSSASSNSSMPSHFAKPSEKYN